MDEITTDGLCPHCNQPLVFDHFIDDHEWPEYGDPIYNYMLVYRCTGCKAEVDEDHVTYPDEDEEYNYGLGHEG